MAANKKLLILPGDGIGPEVMVQVRRVMDWLAKNRKLEFDVTEDYIGGAAYDVYGSPLSDETLSEAMEADAVLLGAVGGPKWDSLPFEMKPERGLLGLRKEMGLFANLRPAVVFDALADASSLKAEVVKGLDIMIIRELTGGIYFGEPQGVEEGPGGQRKGYNTLVYRPYGRDGEELVFNASNNEIPRIDGKDLDYEYPMTFDSPYIKSKYKSGKVKIRYGSEEIDLDFNGK